MKRTTRIEMTLDEDKSIRSMLDRWRVAFEDPTKLVLDIGRSEAALCASMFIRYEAGLGKVMHERDLLAHRLLKAEAKLKRRR